VALSQQSSVRLFRFSGIDVFLHWSWFAFAIFEINARNRRYTSFAWNVAEYLALFAIVLMHEFGHALACRQVGGVANRIVLWPLGGVAYVDPPPRPGATLWSIVAGPLVNVALLPIFTGFRYLSSSLGWAHSMPNLDALLYSIWWIDIGLLAFNILPIYPLDGGQILRALLWFPLGRARSLMVTTVLGFFGIAGFVGLAVWQKSEWLGVLAAFMLLNCWGGLKHARALSKIAKLPRRDGFACPRCKTAPPIGNFWKCPQCQQAFDTFQSGATCPTCGARFSVTKCIDCGGLHPMHEWAVATLTPAGL
jgi:Zn-dependent protease